METKLFPEKEMFIKERPKYLTESLAQEFYLKMAKEVIDSGWSNDDPEDIASDLEELSFCDSGYEKAKDLESFHKKASYDIDSSFIEWLEDIEYEKSQCLEKQIKEWVKIHEIKPNLQKGNKLQVNADIGRSFKTGDIIFITGLYEETAVYLLSKNPEESGGVVVAFERVEELCSFLNS